MAASRTRRAARAAALMLGCLGAMNSPSASAQTVRVCTADVFDPAQLAEGMRAVLADVPAQERSALGIRIASCTAQSARVTVTLGTIETAVDATFADPAQAHGAVLRATVDALRIVRASATGAASGPPPPRRNVVGPSVQQQGFRRLEVLRTNQATWATEQGRFPREPAFSSLSPDDLDYLPKPDREHSDAGVARSRFRRIGAPPTPQRRLDLAFDAGIRAYVAPVPSGAYTFRMRSEHRHVQMELLYGTNRITGIVASDSVQLHMLTFATGLRRAFSVRRVELSVGALADVGLQFLRGRSTVDTETSLGGSGSAGARLEFALHVPLAAHRLRFGIDAGVNRGITAVAVDFFGDRALLGGFHGSYFGVHVGYGRARRAEP